MQNSRISRVRLLIALGLTLAPLALSATVAATHLGGSSIRGHERDLMTTDLGRLGPASANGRQARDALGGGIATGQIEYNDRPEAHITRPWNNTWLLAGAFDPARGQFYAETQLLGWAIDDEDGWIPATQLLWYTTGPRPRDMVFAQAGYGFPTARFYVDCDAGETIQHRLFLMAWDSTGRSILKAGVVNVRANC